jgi:dTDP-4-dehydrorhamnose 3,5-epimerase
MNIQPTELPDVYIIEPQVYRDERGYFFETFNLDRLQSVIGVFNITQSNQSKSKAGVIRGLHFQKPPFTQAKLVHVIKGAVLDVIVDIRTDSPTFGQHMSVVLDGQNKTQLFIPRGFAHGFITLTKDALFQYIIDNQYAPNFESGIRFDDETLKIGWKKNNTYWLKKSGIIVGEKDKKLPTFSESSFNTKAEYNYNPIALQY